MGNWTVKHYATYEDESQEFDFTAILSLDSVCATTFTNIETDATLASYDSSAFDNVADEFYIGNTAYFRLEVSDELQTITSIALDSVSVKQVIQHQGSPSTVITDGATSLSLTEISNALERTIDFSLNLDTATIKGNEIATVSATVTIDYIDTRRFLAIDDRHGRILVVEEIPRRILAYVDTNSQMKVTHVILPVNQEFCNTENGEIIEIEAIQLKPCEENAAKTLTRKCTTGGWEIIVDQCSTTMPQTDNLTSESLNKETENNGTMWEIIFFSLLSMALIGVIYYVINKVCSKPIVKSTGALSPAEATTTILHTTGETKC